MHNIVLRQHPCRICTQFCSIDSGGALYVIDSGGALYAIDSGGTLYVTDSGCALYTVLAPKGLG